jgi:hypothetical protein
MLRQRRRQVAIRRAGRYLLRAQTGRDATGVVWRGSDTLLLREVVVREVTLAERLPADQRNRFNRCLLRRWLAVTQIGHPGVATPFDVVQEQGRTFLVSEPTDAPTLAELVQENRPCTPAEAAAIGRQLLDVLRAAHRNGVVHRDVRPENVLVLRDGHVQLTHFAITVSANGLEAPTRRAESPFTPPQELIEPGSPDTDLWSLAATLYWAVEHQPPPDGVGEWADDPPRLTRAEALALVLDHRRPWRQGWRSDYFTRAGPLAPLLEALLLGSPEQVPSAAELGRQLDEIANGQRRTEAADDGRRVLATPAADKAAPAEHTPTGSVASGGAHAAHPALVVPAPPAPSAPPEPGSPAYSLAATLASALKRGAQPFGLAFAAYLAFGLYLAVGTGEVNGDTLSRVGNAYYVLYSRHPHLSAIGFVWPPLPSLLLIPFLPLSALWPPLTTHAVVAVVESSAFMAGAVHQMKGLFADLGAPRTAALVVTATFAVHPAIAYYGANGLSEAPFLFLLIVATRQLARWLRVPTSIALVHAGLALSLAYLTRYEGAVAGAGAALLVGGVSYLRARGGWQWRGQIALADISVLVAPLGFVIIAWSATSWLIVGTPFAQFTSEYGNAAILDYQPPEPSRAVSAALQDSWVYAHELLPLFFVILAAGCIAAWRRRNIAILAPLALLGSVLLFTLVAYAMGQVGAGLRYYIVVVPLAHLLGGITATSRSGALPTFPYELRRRHPLRRREILIWLMPALLALGLPFSHSGLTGDRRNSVLTTYTGEQAAARYLDSLHLREGEVLVDAATGYPIVLSSRRPKQFVINSDRDFDAALADPWGMQVRYLFVPTPTGYSQADAIHRFYPKLYDSGAGIAELVREFDTIGRPSWRLYKLRES